MTLEAQIARQIYEELRNTARESRSVRLPVRMAELQRLGRKRRTINFSAHI